MTDDGAMAPIWPGLVPEEAAMSMVTGDEDHVDEVGGLVYDEKSKSYVHPRVAKLLAKKITVADLDDEELARGQVRNADGRFDRRKPSKIPREFHDEMMRRIMEEGVNKLRRHMLSALDTIVDIMEDEELDAGVRFRAAQYVYERIAGKTPDKVEVAVTVAPWEQTMKGIMKELPDAGYFEATVVEEDDDRG